MTESQSDQRAPVEADRTVVDLPVPLSSEKKAIELSEKDLLSKVQKRHFVKARKLLRALKCHNDVFGIRADGNVIIDGKIQSLNIRDCLSETFYQNKAVHVSNFSSWLDLLNRLNLKSHVTNPKYHEKNLRTSTDADSAWYFIGEICDEGL